MSSRIIISRNTEVETFVSEYLASHGYPNPNLHDQGALIGRVFRLDRVTQTLDNGTDRDELSNICTLQQRYALESEGLGAGDIIYANELGIVIKYVLPGVDEPKALSVYDSKKMDFAIPTEKQIIGLDEMFKVRTPYTFRDALIAVFCPDSR